MEAVKTNSQTPFPSNTTALPPALTKPIGRPAGTGYTCADDIKSIKDFLTVLHRGVRGARCLAQKHETLGFRQFLRYDSQLTDDFLQSFEGQNDVYVGMNLMLNKIRGNGNVKRLTALYADLDCYKIGLSAEATYELLCREYFFIEVPMPSITVFSGRGVQLIWLIDEDPKAIPRWDKAEKFLCERLEPLGADHKATDPARILRLPFTRNSKGGEVTVRQFIDVAYTLHEIIKGYEIPIKYPKKQLRDMSRTVHPYNTATEGQRIAARSIAERLSVPCPNFESYNETCAFIGRGMKQLGYSKSKKSKSSRKKARRKLSKSTRAGSSYSDAVNQARLTSIIEDLKILATLRKGVDCGRELILFLIRYFTAELTYDFACALKVCLEVNETFDCPLPREEVLEATRSAEKHLSKGGLYKYKDRTLSEDLGITIEEEEHLHYLTATAFADRKKEKDRLRKKNAYRDKLAKEGGAPLSEKIQKKVVALAELSEQGLSRDAICAQLGISTATFYRYKKIAEKMAANKDTEVPVDAAQQNEAPKAKAPVIVVKQHDIPTTDVQRSKAEVVDDPLAAYIAEGWTVMDNSFDPFATDTQIDDVNDAKSTDDESAFVPTPSSPGSLSEKTKNRRTKTSLPSHSHFFSAPIIERTPKGFCKLFNHWYYGERGSLLPRNPGEKGRGDPRWRWKVTGESGFCNRWWGSACALEARWWRKGSQKPGPGKGGGRGGGSLRPGAFLRGPSRVAESPWLDVPGGVSHRSRGSPEGSLGPPGLGWGPCPCPVASARDGPPGCSGEVLEAVA